MQERETVQSNLKSFGSYFGRKHVATVLIISQVVKERE